MKAVDPFNPHQDAQKLYKAMKRWGTDEDALINVLAYRTRYQRRQIGDDFHRMYGKHLGWWLKRETSGWFRKTLNLMILDPYSAVVEQLKDAIDGVSRTMYSGNAMKYELMLLDLLLPLMKHEKQVVEKYFEQRYKQTLENAMKGAVADDEILTACRMVSNYERSNL